MNPQSLNRYTYCLNNPLKYIDPTGYYETFELGQWGYEQECEQLGLDPNEGYYIGHYNGKADYTLIGDLHETFVEWVGDTPYPFDYLSQSASQKAAAKYMQNLGVKNIMSYHRDLKAEPIMVIEAIKGGWVDKNIIKAFQPHAIAAAIPYIRLSNKSPCDHTQVAR